MNDSVSHCTQHISFILCGFWVVAEFVNYYDLCDAQQNSKWFITILSEVNKWITSNLTRMSMDKQFPYNSNTFTIARTYTIVLFNKISDLNQKSYIYCKMLNCPHDLHIKAVTAVNAQSLDHPWIYSSNCSRFLYFYLKGCIIRWNAQSLCAIYHIRHEYDTQVNVIKTQSTKTCKGKWMRDSGRRNPELCYKCFILYCPDSRMVYLWFGITCCTDWGIWLTHKTHYLRIWN